MYIYVCIFIYIYMMYMYAYTHPHKTILQDQEVRTLEFQTNHTI